MNPLNSITGTIVAGFVLALVLGLLVNAKLRDHGDPSKPRATLNTQKTG